MELSDIPTAELPDFATTRSALGNATVAVRLDKSLGKERTFLDFDTSLENSASTSTVGNEDVTTTHLSSSAALDFILALEWPCRDHHAHDGFGQFATMPPVQSSSEDGESELHGHSMTMTAAVYHSMRPAHSSAAESGSAMIGSPADANNATTEWCIDDSEIDK